MQSDQYIGGKKLAKEFFRNHITKFKKNESKIYSGSGPRVIVTLGLTPDSKGPLPAPGFQGVPHTCCKKHDFKRAYDI